MEQTSRMMRGVWDRMSDEEKRPYVQIYEVEKAKYERDMHAYYQNLYKRGDKKKNEDKEKEK